MGEGLIVGGGAYNVEMVAQFEAHADLQRVNWNVTGTVLSSSGDDGRVRMWKQDHLGNWKQFVALSAEQYTQLMLRLNCRKYARMDVEFDEGYEDVGFY